MYVYIYLYVYIKKKILESDCNEVTFVKNRRRILNCPLIVLWLLHHQHGEKNKPPEAQT